MKNLLPVFLLYWLLATGCNPAKEKAFSSSPQGITAEEIYARGVNNGLYEDTIKKSLPRQMVSVIAGNNIAINYYSPGVRGRMIWGGLVPYGQVWVTGAHSASKISFTKDIKISQTTLVAGTYAIFTIPGKEKWQFILNKNYEQHLADDYREELDVLRLEIEPVTNNDTVQRLSYDITEHGEGTASIQIYWEKIALTIPFQSLQSGAATSMPSGKQLIKIRPANKRDPVCYMPVSAGITDSFTLDNKLYGFCSPECKRLFVEDPGKYKTTVLK